MRLWIDTEFNSYKGELISMALVDEVGREWYEVLECAKPDPWVARNVMPKLNREPITLAALQQSLEAFLRPYEVAHVIADWPEDIQHFCETLITGPGMRIDTPLLTLEIRRDLDADKSLIPHQALADARALREAHIGRDR